jgi:flagellar assembly protein FliH
MRVGSALEQHLQAAYQQGLQEGQNAARQEVAGQVDAMASRLARTIEELSGLRQRFRHEAEAEIVALAIAIARRILHRELTVAPDALLGLVKAALEKIELREVHRVRVSPGDAPLVQQHLESMGLPQRVDVIADPGLARGSAILESGRGALDVSVETQLAEIERGFADLVRRA